MFNLVIKYFSPFKNIPLLPQVFDSITGIFTALTNKNIPRYIDEIENRVKTWEGVALSQHKYGGLQFNYLNKELGHIHSNGLLDIHFPKNIRDQLVTSGTAMEHHVFKNSGWISFYVKTVEDVDKAIELLRSSYSQIRLQ
jgi:hypothetical protein